MTLHSRGKIRSKPSRKTKCLKIKIRKSELINRDEKAAKKRRANDPVDSLAKESAGDKCSKQPACHQKNDDNNGPHEPVPNIFIAIIRCNSLQNNQNQHEGDVGEAKSPERT